MLALDNSTSLPYPFSSAADVGLKHNLSTPVLQIIRDDFSV